MNQPAKIRFTTKELLQKIAAKSTGRMAASLQEKRLEVYLLGGEIVGALASDDHDALLRRIRLARALPPDRLAILTAAATGPGDFFGTLLDLLPSDQLDPILYDRFQENMIRWVGLAEAPNFEELSTVFVDNMQFGLNSVQVLHRCCEAADLALSYPLDTEITAGEGAPTTPAESTVLAYLGEGSSSIGDLLAKLPLEPYTARACIARMLDMGQLLEADAVLQDMPTLDTPLPPSDPNEEDDEADAPTVRAVNELLQFDEEEPHEDEDDQSPPIPDGPISPGPDLSKWLHTGDLDEEDMAFFEDYEDDRGGGAGSFTTESHNLDRVDVTDGVSEIIEADEAPAVRFSAPVLSEDVALQKLDVGNEVLAKVCAAFDDVKGAGRGQSVIQILIDGSPASYSILFHGITVDRSGQLPADAILDNLECRPPSEHRHLLNRALKDIIERALDAAADELPDTVVDALYESVAGYNQRLGL